MKQRLISVLAAALMAAQGLLPAHAQIPDATLTLLFETRATETPSGTPAGSPADLAFQRVSQNVKAGSRLRVLSATGPFHNRGSEVTPQGIHRLGTTGEAGAPGLVPWSEIHQVQKRVSGSGKGAAIGAVTAGALGLTVGLAIANADIGLGGSSNDSEGAAVVGFTLTTALLGCVLGSIIGAPFGKWQTISRDVDS